MRTQRIFERALGRPSAQASTAGLIGGSWAVSVRPISPADRSASPTGEGGSMPPSPVSARQKKKGGSGECRSLPERSVSGALVGGEIVGALLGAAQDVDRHPGAAQFLGEVGLNARALANDRLYRLQ